jgi:hypothetical protein
MIMNTQYNSSKASPLKESSLHNIKADQIKKSLLEEAKKRSGRNTSGDGSREGRERERERERESDLSELAFSPTSSVSDGATVTHPDGIVLDSGVSIDGEREGDNFSPSSAASFARRSFSRPATTNSNSASSGKNNEKLNSILEYLDEVESDAGCNLSAIDIGTPPLPLNHINAFIVLLSPSRERK